MVLLSKKAEKKESVSRKGAKHAKKLGKDFSQRRKARKEIRKGFLAKAQNTQRKSRGFHAKAQNKARAEEKHAMNLVGAGLAPALFYFTKKGRTLEKVEEFTQRNIASREIVEGFTQRR